MTPPTDAIDDTDEPGGGARRPGPSDPAIVAPTFERHLDEGWRRRALVDDVRSGLTRRPRRLSPQWLYDDRGSELFERITRLPEYYPTEAEREILGSRADLIAARTAADTLIELGAGTSDKTRTLLDALHASGRLRRFVPLDVSEQTLRVAADELSRRYPGLAVHGVVGDFHRHLHDLPTDGTPMLAFLGSTIGNLYPTERAEFLRRVADWMPAHGWLLLGVDLVKPVDRLMAAYDDAEGVTAAFTRNLLHVLNRELGADFDPGAFEHVALWDPLEQRVDIRLRATAHQVVALPDAGLVVEFCADEELQVEISSKFTLAGVDDELAAAGLAAVERWTDAGRDVAVVLAEHAHREPPA